MKIYEIISYYNINGFLLKGTDKYDEHSYTEIYEKLLDPYINKNIKLLEIGTLYGGSALIWHEYLPLSYLYLVDIEYNISDKIKKILNPDRYEFHKCDAYSNNFTNYLKEKNLDGFDIIIDDGPHSLISQVKFIKKYLPLLKEDGIMIIEDVIFSDTKILLNQIDPDYKCEIIDLRCKKNRFDDILIFIYNKKNK